MSPHNLARAAISRHAEAWASRVLVLFAAAVAQASLTHDSWNCRATPSDEEEMQAEKGDAGSSRMGEHTVSATTTSSSEHAGVTWSSAKGTHLIGGTGTRRLS